LIGPSEQVQLIFGRKLQRKTATDGRCRTRMITEGVVPSLHVYYKNTHLKQYHKEGRALRTETTINNAYDFGWADASRTSRPCARSAWPPTAACWKSSA